jgi:WD40 repeat protein
VAQERWHRQLPEAVTALRWRSPADDAQHASQPEHLLAAGADGWIRCHDAAGGTEQLGWEAHQGGITDLCVRRVPAKPKEARPAVLASAGEDGRVQLWDARGGLVSTLAEESGWVEHLAWTPDGRLLAAAVGRSIHLWRGEESLGVWYDANRSVLALAWAPDGKRLATAANKGLHLWQVGGQAPAQLLQFPGAPVVLGWRPDGKALAVGTQDGFLQVWRQGSAPGQGSKGSGRKGGSSQLTMRGYPAKVTCLDWHPSRSRVATAGGQDLVLWDIPAAGEGKPTPLRLHRTAVTALAYAPDGALLASGDRDGRVCIWSDSGAPLQSLSLDAEVACATWSADGSAIAFGCTDGCITVLDIDSVARADPGPAGAHSRRRSSQPS